MPLLIPVPTSSGYTSTADAVGTLRLYFDTEANAVSYAEKVGLSYAVEKPAPPKKRVVKSFEGNFKWRYDFFES